MFGWFDVLLKRQQRDAVLDCESFQMLTNCIVVVASDAHAICEQLAEQCDVQTKHMTPGRHKTHNRYKSVILHRQLSHRYMHFSLSN